MSDEELEQIAGGTVKQLEDLAVALSEKSKFVLNWSPGQTAVAHIPGANAILAKSVKDVLRDNYKIEANIDLGWIGLGWASENNTYKDMTTGKTLTHKEVLDRIG